MKNSQDTGELSKWHIACRLMSKNYKVLTPIGENHRFDLAFYEDSEPIAFKTVQCKTARIKNGVVRIKLCSVVKNSKTKKYENRGYKGQIDFICAFCPFNGKCYIVPETEIGVNEIYLRIDPPKKSSPNIKWAKDYEL